MTIKNLPVKYNKIWQLALPLLRKSRPGDDHHAMEVVSFILNYRGRLKLDYNVLIPAAMLHDIGHSAILPEHFKYVTGPEKMINGKLVHMLAGAKIAKDILVKVKYNQRDSREIIEIISMHDGDSLAGVKVSKIFNTTNKKLFHDIDSMDRYNEKRLKNALYLYKDRKQILKILQGLLKNLFFEEFRNLAKANLKKMLK